MSGRVRCLSSGGRLVLERGITLLFFGWLQGVLVASPRFSPLLAWFFKPVLSVCVASFSIRLGRRIVGLTRLFFLHSHPNGTTQQQSSSHGRFASSSCRLLREPRAKIGRIHRLPNHVIKDCIITRMMFIIIIMALNPWRKQSIAK